MELRQVQKKTTWNDAANVINTNTQTIAQKIAAMEAGRGTIKGYFASLDALQSAYPVAGIGDTAYIGASYPYAVYKYTESGWVDTGATGGESIDAYTKTESDDKFLSKSGGTINGHLTVQGDILTDTDEHDIGESSRPFNIIYATEVYEGSKSLSQKYATREMLSLYATKEEASDFINVGVKNSLQEAINAIPYRVGLQVVTFTNKSTLKRKKVSMWFYGLTSNAQVAVSINGEHSSTITVVGGDDVTRNRSIYDAIIADATIGGYIQSHSFSESYKTMIFTLTESAGDAQVNWIGDVGISCQMKTPQQYSPVKNESYQLKYNTTEESIFLDTANWESYTASQDSDTWGTFD